MFDISDEKYEELRLILEKQNGRSYTLEEVKEIGDELVGFYDLLIKICTEADESISKMT